MDGNQDVELALFFLDDLRLCNLETPWRPPRNRRQAHPDGEEPPATHYRQLLETIHIDVVLRTS